MTCGDAGCQCGRHTHRCRSWHACSKESRSNHYLDVVVPFRQRHPTYQRRWRLASRLREIREESRGLTERLVPRVQRAVTWGQSLQVLAASEVEQPRSSTGKSLNEALASAAQLGGMLEQLQAVASELGVVGL